MRPLTVRTRAVPAHHDLIGRLPDERGPLCWVRGTDGLVGWGETARFITRGPDRFTAAAAWWASFSSRLEVDDDVMVPGSGAVAFVSFTFADHPDESVLVVPKVVLGRHRGTSWMTEIGVDDRDRRAGRPVTPVRHPGLIRYSDGELPVARWRGAVAEAVTRIRAGALHKAVLAHDLLATADQPIDPRFLLTGLAREYPTCWAYSVDGLVGATPELLVRRTGTEVASRVLAGTTWVGAAHGGPSADQLGPALLAHRKNRAEHRYAVESMLERLRPLCAELPAPTEPAALRLPNVTHLASDITARLDPADPPTLLRLAGAIHPTAAIGGSPTGPALELIAELEAMNRGRFGGPVGWVDGAGDGELGLALRCAQLDGPTARLFAGCGVVADSDPDSEAAEVAAKMRAVRSALDRRAAPTPTAGAPGDPPVAPAATTAPRRTCRRRQSSETGDRSAPPAQRAEARTGGVGAASSACSPEDLVQVTVAR
jgi:menaquinone-specific isochorismate synthase